MSLLKGILGVLSFLTIIPVPEEMRRLDETARYMQLFPIIGVPIGFISGVAGWILQHFLPTSISGLAALGSILLITGLHHTDGLLDFGDGIMCQGDSEKKIGAMRDTKLGCGGFSLAFIVLLSTFLAIESMSPVLWILALTTAEVTAKASMVFAAGIGRSAVEGMNRPFIDQMHKGNRILKLTIPLAILVLISYFLLHLVGLFSALSGLIAASVVVYVAHRNFRGLTGDVFGAVNDISRMICLVMLVAGF